MDPDVGLVISGVLAQSPAQFESLWAIREGIPEAVGKAGKPYKYDLSIPVSKFKEIIDKTREHLQSKGLLHENAVKDIVSFGHFGDGAEALYWRVLAADPFCSRQHTSQHRRRCVYPRDRGSSRAIRVPTRWYALWNMSQGRRLIDNTLSFVQRIRLC
jgi:FAD/FMN-containing dehydrogenase